MPKSRKTPKRIVRFMDAANNNGRALKSAKDYAEFSKTQTGLLHDSPDDDKLLKVLEIMEKGAKAFPQNFGVMSELARWYIRANHAFPGMGYADKAIEALEDTYELNTDHIRTLDRLGSMYTLTGDYEEAERVFAEMADLKGSMTEWIYTRLGHLYNKSGNPDLAIICYGAALELGILEGHHKRTVEQALGLLQDKYNAVYHPEERKVVDGRIRRIADEMRDGNDAPATDIRHEEHAL